MYSKISSLLLTCVYIGLTQSLFAQNVGIGTNTPNVSAALDVTATNKGFIMPRMTTAQRDAIVSPATGLQIFNLDDECVDSYDGTNWIKTCGFKVTGVATDPDHPTPDSWVPKASFGGTSRVTAIGFSINNKGYIGTGYDGSFKKIFGNIILQIIHGHKRQISEEWQDKLQLGFP